MDNLIRATGSLEVSTQFSYHSSLNLQLDEIENLQSIYFKPGEIVIDNYGILLDMREFVSNKTKILPNKINFEINLNIDDTNTVNINVILPQKYPSVRPEVHVRCPILNRNEQVTVNEDLNTYINSLDIDTCCLYDAILWIETRFNNLEYDLKSSSPTNVEIKPEKKFSRLWIYSHHIYSTTKRKDIVKLSHELGITGFCLPGKPGAICIEGCAKDCTEWWKIISSMNWHSIQIIYREENLSTDENFDGNRKFKTFDEISFQTHNSKKRGYHMDMGEFKVYLEEHDCAFMFKEYFGFEGKKTTNI